MADEYDINEINLTRSGLAAYLGANAKLDYVMRTLDNAKPIVRQAQVLSVLRLELYAALRFLNVSREIDRLNAEVDRVLVARQAYDDAFQRLQSNAGAGVVIAPDDPRLPPNYVVTPQTEERIAARYPDLTPILYYGRTFNPVILEEQRGILASIDPGEFDSIRAQIENLTLSVDALVIHAVDGYQEEHRKLVAYMNQKLEEVQQEVEVSEGELIKVSTDHTYDTTAVLDVTMTPLPEDFEELGLLYPHNIDPQDNIDLIRAELATLFGGVIPTRQQETYLNQVSSESVLQGCPIDARLSFCTNLINLAYNYEVRSTGLNAENAKAGAGVGIDNNNNDSFNLKQRIVALDRRLKRLQPAPPPVGPPPVPPQPEEPETPQ